MAEGTSTPHKVVFKDDNLLEIVLYPDPFLNKKAREITQEEFQEGKADGYSLREVTDKMINTMYEAEGVGLAGPQVGLGLRVFTADPECDPDDPNPMVIFNPVISEEEGNAAQEEGCLSMPGLRAKVKRATKIRLKGMSLIGEEIDMEATDFLARIFMHETDHLEGVLFTQRISATDRFLLRKKIAELEDLYELKKLRRSKNL